MLQHDYDRVLYATINKRITVRILRKAGENVSYVELQPGDSHPLGMTEADALALVETIPDMLARIKDWAC